MFETGWLSGDPGLLRFFKLQIGSFSLFLLFEDSKNNYLGIFVRVGQP